VSKGTTDPISMCPNSPANVAASIAKDSILSLVCLTATLAVPGIGWVTFLNGHTADTAVLAEWFRNRSGSKSLPTLLS
jgi:hypothetical protein